MLFMHLLSLGYSASYSDLFPQLNQLCYTIYARLNTHLARSNAWAFLARVFDVRHRLSMIAACVFICRCFYVFINHDVITQNYIIVLIFNQTACVN